MYTNPGRIKDRPGVAIEGILPEGRDVILPVAGGGVYRGEECRKIVYCKDGSRKGTYPNTQFDFLGYTFRARTVKNSKKNSLFVSFTPAVSSKAVTAMRQKTRKLNYRNRTDLSLADIARLHNPILRGWLEYYGKFCRSAMYPVLRHFNMTLRAWAMKKYKRLKGHKIRAARFLEGLAEKQSYLFVHWQRGMVGAFA